MIQNILKISIQLSTVSDKTLKEKVYEIPKNPKYDVYQRVLASMVRKIFDKKTGSVQIVNEKLAEKLHKPVIKKFKRRKVYARFNPNLGGLFRGTL